MRIDLSLEIYQPTSHKYLQYNPDGSVEPIRPQGYVYEPEGLVYYD